MDWGSIYQEMVEGFSGQISTKSFDGAIGNFYKAFLNKSPLVL